MHRSTDGTRSTPGTPIATRVISLPNRERTVVPEPRSIFGCIILKLFSYGKVFFLANRPSLFPGFAKSFPKDEYNCPALNKALEQSFAYISPFASVHFLLPEYFTNRELLQHCCLSPLSLRPFLFDRFIGCGLSFFTEDIPKTESILFVVRVFFPFQLFE